MYLTAFTNPTSGGVGPKAQDFQAGLIAVQALMAGQAAPQTAPKTGATVGPAAAGPATVAAGAGVQSTLAMQDVASKGIAKAFLDSLKIQDTIKEEQERALLNQRAIQDRIDKIYRENYSKALRGELEEQKAAARKQLRGDVLQGAQIAAQLIGTIAQRITAQIGADAMRVRGDTVGASLAEQKANTAAVSGALRAIPLVGGILGGLSDGIGSLFTAAKERFVVMDQTLRQEAVRLAQFSAPVAQAGAQAQAAGVRRQMREGELIGEQLAKLTDAQSRLDDLKKLNQIATQIGEISKQTRKTSEQENEQIIETGKEMTKSFIEAVRNNDEEAIKQLIKLNAQLERVINGPPIGEKAADIVATALARGGGWKQFAPDEGFRGQEAGALRKQRDAAINLPMLAEGR